jgi:hypothetical protein
VLWSAVVFVLISLCYFVALHVEVHVPSLRPDSYTYINFTPERTAGYPAVLALARLLGVGLGGVIVFQLIAFSLSPGYLFEVLSRYVGHGIAAVACAVILANPRLIICHYSILTESLTYSLLIVIIGLSIESVFQGQGVKRLTLISVCIGLAISMRPAALALILYLPVLWLFLRTSAKRS